MTDILKKICHPLNFEPVDSLLQEEIKSFNFPLDTLADQLKAFCKLEHLEFSRTNATYKKGNDLTQGLSKELLTLCYSDVKTSSKCFVLLSFSAAQELIQIFEHKSEHEALLQKEDIVKDYCKYLSTIFLQNIKSLELVDHLSLELCSSALPKNTSYCIDLEIKSQEKNIALRLVFETEFLLEMSKQIKRRRSLLELVNDLPNVPLNVSTTLDMCQLNQLQINQLNVGDVILINTQFHPKEKKGSFTLTLEQLPLAFARYKEGKIKILETIKNSQENISNG